jgi:hypothetical protein
MKEEKTHSLPSFSAYLHKVFSFRSQVQTLSDSRREPDISPQSVFLALFHAFVFRLPSLRQREAELTHSHLQQWIQAERGFRDDTLRYSLCGFDLAPLEQMLVDANRRLKRNKALNPGRVQGCLVAALDGIEVLSSYSRHCDSCLQRRVKRRGPGGTMEELTQYYHRAVGCQIIHSEVKPFLAVEWLQPGEGEETAALRLLTRLPELYGSRFFDILLLDALYAQTPVLELAEKVGWEVIISLKQNARDLYQSAIRLFAQRKEDTRIREERAGKTYEALLWDESNLPFSLQDSRPLRVVRSEETLEWRHYRRNQLQPKVTHHEWIWITTLNAQAFPAAVIRRLGHDRWKQENNGWMDLTKHWAFKHGFLHACRHRPKRGQKQEVANRGLAAVILVLLLAFNLSSAFVHCHSKLVRRYRLSAVAVARQLYFWLAQAPPSIRAPD